MGLSIQGLKMVATTAAMSFIFCYSFIITGSLWTAIGLHLSVNTFLHAITGLDGGGKAVLNPIFEGSFPENFDLAFWLFLGNTILIKLVFNYFTKDRLKGYWKVYSV